jgi:dTDP-glucose 4,6-dehydratase
MKTLLVTGGAGFIGSNFIKYILFRHEDYRVINLDLLTYAGNLESLRDIEDNPNYSFIKGDIRDEALIDRIMSKGVDYIVNFAAESHVDRSIVDPGIFVSTNIVGTQVLIDAAKKAWKLTDDKYDKSYKAGVKYLQVSTDEVYGSLGETGYFTEETALDPSSPYSASKTSADLLVKAYVNTFGFPANITRCSNNYGPYQFPEKLIPLMIANALEDKQLPVYGDGMNIRDWLFVEDHCSAIDKVLHEAKIGETYNIGGNNEKANIYIVKTILNQLGIDEGLIKYVKDRPGHDRRYAIDSSKLKKDLNWEPKYSFEEGIKETINWYLDNKVWWEKIRSGEYTKYYDKMYDNKTIV